MPKTINSALLIYPPTGIYDRFERCQSPIESESISIIRPPLDLMYLGGILERNNVKVHIRDYPAERKTWKTVSDDVKNLTPDLLLVSSTIPTSTLDSLAFKIAKGFDNSTVCILKGFFPDKGIHLLLNKPEIDMILREEPEFALEEFIQGKPLSSIDGLSYRVAQKEIKVNQDRDPPPELDTLPFPARHLTNNSLYRMPDNGRKMGLILLAKGCYGECIFCLVPHLNHKKVRLRSPDSVASELEECVHKYGINDFWFRADSFTINKAWAMQICKKIIDRRLAIRWATSSRVDTLDEAMVSAMKESGCFAIGFGAESGSEDTLKKIKKNITKQQVKNAVQLCLRHGIQSYLFFILGFPWEGKSHIMETINFAKHLDGDIVNFSFAVPFPGTELFDFSLESGLIDRNNYYSAGDYGNPLMGTKYLQGNQLVKMEKSAYRAILLRPSYIFKHLRKINSPKNIYCYIKAACHLLKLSF